jgi:hypothetical protein
MSVPIGSGNRAQSSFLAQADANGALAGHGINDLGNLPQGYIAQLDANGLTVGPGLQRPHDIDRFHVGEETPLYVQGSGDADEVAMNDIDQNSVADCWVLAPLAEIALKNPDLIKNMIRDNGDGTYTVTFHLNPDREVTVDAEMPANVDLQIPGVSSMSGTYVPHAGEGDKNIRGHGEIWVQIIEKAWATYKGGYDKIWFGNPAEFMAAVTGHQPTTFPVVTRPFDAFGVPYGPPLAISFAELREKFNAGSMVLFTTRKDFLSDNPYGLVPDHVYAVKQMYVGTDGAEWVELHNPWNSEGDTRIRLDQLMSAPYPDVDSIVVG